MKSSSKLIKEKQSPNERERLGDKAHSRRVIHAISTLDEYIH